jgi:hypothetical protein
LSSSHCIAAHHYKRTRGPIAVFIAEAPVPPANHIRIGSAEAPVPPANHIRIGSATGRMPPAFLFVASPSSPRLVAIHHLHTHHTSIITIDTIDGRSFGWQLLEGWITDFARTSLRTTFGTIGCVAQSNVPLLVHEQIVRSSCVGGSYQALSHFTS